MRQIGYGLLLLIVIGLLAMGANYISQQSSAPTQNPTVHEDIQPSTFAYKGEEGRDALSLMKEKTSVEQDASGMVISINGRKADSTKKEYWAMYVNDRMSQVGPADYMTKSSDIILWKIQTY